MISHNITKHNKTDIQIVNKYYLRYSVILTNFRIPHLNTAKLFRYDKKETAPQIS